MYTRPRMKHAHSVRWLLATALLGLLFGGCSARALAPGTIKPATVPFEFQVVSPEATATLNVNVVRVAGTVSDPLALITLNDERATIQDNGDFDAYIELAKGQNNIRVEVATATQRMSTMLTPTFEPSLSIYLERPVPEKGVDYTTEPIAMRGWVSDPRARVTVGGEPVDVSPDGIFTPKVCLPLVTVAPSGEVSIPALSARAALGDKVDEFRLPIGAMPDGAVTPPAPGFSRQNLARLTVDHSTISMKAGESRSFNVVLETRKGIPVPTDFSYEAHLADSNGRYLALPEGFEFTSEPPKFTAYPHTTYRSRATMSVGPSVVPGTYTLDLGGSSAYSLPSTRFEVTVEP
ncbi:MAG: hypothetical protein HYX87_01785 [Chloroflexi bacterium]|nr:hypothetical protein [Chloroflexota bacterium]